MPITTDIDRISKSSPSYHCDSSVVDVKFMFNWNLPNWFSKHPSAYLFDLNVQ